jgi:hypothetical protein
MADRQAKHTAGPTILTQAQIGAAHGAAFTVPRVLDRPEVVFKGRYSSGNYGVRRLSDPPYFGDVAISPAQAEPLLAAIAARYDARGRLRAIAKAETTHDR